MMNDERAMLNELIETYTTDVQQGSLADRNASSRALDDSLDRIIAERDAEIARLDARVTQLHGRATKAEAERDAAREALREALVYASRIEGIYGAEEYGGELTSVLVETLSSAQGEQER